MCINTVTVPNVSRYNDILILAIYIYCCISNRAVAACVNILATSEDDMAGPHM